ncbi:MAG: tRNA dihydrouridine synthase DusB [Phycisphaeraceae bacterium]|nr:tRNA dihydrouridine synthase DusB [Phycisphaeraceae bacterium]
MLHIGPVSLETPLLLAPIAGYCDLAYRLVVRSVRGEHGGVGLACTDLLCPQAILSENQKSLWLAATSAEDRPLCMQLYGRDPQIMAQAATWAAGHGAAVVDVNMGCPVDKVTKKNGGSKLLCEPGLAVEIVKAIVRVLPAAIPVTCKIRLGWDDQTLIVDSLPIALADAGAAAITVHGRTTAQMFRGQARLEGIAKVVEAVGRRHPQVAVIGNGDIKTPADARRMIEATGCHGVMVGRGALSQPWIFRDIAHYLATGEMPEPLTQAQRARLVLDHFENLVRLRGERVAINTLRQRMSWYSPHLQPWAGLKRQVQEIKSAEEFRHLMGTGIDESRRSAVRGAT